MFLIIGLKHMFRFNCLYKIFCLLLRPITLCHFYWSVNSSDLFGFIWEVFFPVELFPFSIFIAQLRFCATVPLTDVAQCTTCGSSVLSILFFSERPAGWISSPLVSASPSLSDAQLHPCNASSWRHNVGHLLHSLYAMKSVLMQKKKALKKMIM